MPEAAAPPLLTPSLYGKDPLHKYGLMTPRFWHGMLPGDFLGEVWRHGGAVSAHGVLTSASILGVGVGNAVGALSQRALYGDKVARSRLEHPPLFVLGHWRSGTTMLHELLIRDPAHSYATTFGCFAPHHFLTTESWLPKLLPWLLPKKRPMDNVATGWDRPQEDEFALVNLGLPSPYRSWMFPQHGPINREWLTLDEVSEPDRARWKRFLEGFVKATAARRPGRVVLKSPPHTARVRTLLEVFPEARFVHLTRDPLVLYPSTVRLWRSLAVVQGLQRPRERYPWIEEEVFLNFERMYAAFERDRGLIPAGRLVELRYEDLVADPKQRLREVYEGLGLGDFAAAERGVDEYLTAERDYKTNRYELPAEVESDVRRRWGAYAQRYGYSS